jgi:hypothetical protein
MRAKDLRKSPRRQLHYPALIDLRDPPTQHNCTLWDVSENGAKIILTKDIELPKHFYLLLSLTGTSRRYCEVIWRQGLSVGIKFLKNDTQPEVAVEKPEVVAV